MIGFDDIFDDYLDSSDGEECLENVNLFANDNLPVKLKVFNTAFNDEKGDLVVSISNPESEAEMEVEVGWDLFDFESSKEEYIIPFDSQPTFRTESSFSETFYSVKSSLDPTHDQNQRNEMKSYNIKEFEIHREVCRICNETEYGEPDDWVCCYGCGEAFHRTCLKSRQKRLRCELPIIYRQKLSGPTLEDRRETFSHAPWFCNQCVNCPSCEEIEELECSPNGENNSPTTEALKSSFVACRHCGRMSCLACYNVESLNSNVQINRFESLQNYSCPGCLKCVNCGLKAGTSCSSSVSGKGVVLYSDSTLCRPCYLSNQMCSHCPRCKQIYHSLPNHYDFGEAPYDPEFSLTPMIQCDSCSSWTHCQCEGISDQEYALLGSSENSKFLCIDCKKPSTEKSKANEDDNCEMTIYRRGHLMILNDTIMFRYWSINEAWKRSLYKFFHLKNPFRFVLTCPELRDGRIESKNLDILVRIFTKQLLHLSRVENSCRKAICPEFLLDPQFLLNFIENCREGSISAKFTDLRAQLRVKIGASSVVTCSRTIPYQQLPKMTVNSSYAKKRRLSLMDLPTRSPFTSASSSPNNTCNASFNNGKATVRYMYMQYLQGIKVDASIHTIDSFSQGLALRPSSISGFGLFASRNFQINSLIIEYCGEMLTGDDLVNKRDALYNLLGKRYQQSCYLFRLDESKVLDATHKGNLSRFINHSCDPNCYSRVVQIDGQKKLLIFASKIIEAGEEILYDYKFPDEDQKIPCRCGSDKCRKWMN